MPLFEYHCPLCHRTHELVVPHNARNLTHTCPECNGDMLRVISSPNVFVSRAGCIEGRSDEFWERADRHKEGQLKKRTDTEREKLHYGDREARRKLEVAHDNLMRQGEPERAESVARKLDEA